MDPRETTHSEEETVREPGGTVERKVSATPTERVEETTSVSRTATGGETTRRATSSGATAGFAKEYSRKKTMFRAYQILWYILGLIEILLAFRFILKLTGANPESGFGSFIYGATSPFAGPFANLFSPSTGRGAETTALLEWSTLIAMIVYALVVWGIVKLMQLGKPVKPGEVEQGIEDV